MTSITSISNRIRKISSIFLSRLTVILSLQTFVLAMSISLALAADVDPQKIRLSLPLPLIPNPSQSLAQHVTTTLLPQLIGSDDQLKQRLGFSSLAQIDNLLLLDPPFKVFRVGLSKLKNYDSSTLNSRLSPILEEENWFMFDPPSNVVWPVRYLFPIREASRPESGCTPASPMDPLRGCVASSVQVKWLRDTGKWEFQQIGRPGLIKKLTQFGNGDTHFVIWIPVLNLHYLAKINGAGQDLMITAIAKDRYVKKPTNSKFPFKQGDEFPGTEVFKQLMRAVEVQQIESNGPPG